MSSKIMAHSAGVKLGFLGRLAGKGIFHHVVVCRALAIYVQSKLMQGWIYYHGNYLDSNLSIRLLNVHVDFQQSSQSAEGVC